MRQKLSHRLGVGGGRGGKGTPRRGRAEALGFPERKKGVHGQWGRGSKRKILIERWIRR